MVLPLFGRFVGHPRPAIIPDSVAPKFAVAYASDVRTGAGARHAFHISFSLVY